VSPERPEQDDFLEDEEQEEYGQRSIFATGWFRAVLVLLVLAVIAVIAVPLIGGWFEPTPPAKVTTKMPEPAKPSEPPAATSPVPSTPTPPSAAQTPSTPTPPPFMGQGPSQTPPARTPPATPPATPAPTTPPAATSTPALPPSATTKAPEKAKAPERTAAATPSKSASKPAASTGGNYWVQVGAFKNSQNADGLAKSLRSAGFQVQVSTVTRDEPMLVVRVGGYPDRAKATAARAELQEKGHSGFVTQGPAK
jgi:septal ring-binding cell division protein DamX